MIKSKKNEFIKKEKERKVKLVIPVNRPMDFLKFNNMFFFRNYFLIYDKKINNHIIEFN